MRRKADAWVYYWNLGYRDGLTGTGQSRRVPSLYLTTYRQGMLQGIADRIRHRSA